MKKTLRILALVLALVITLGTFVSCEDEKPGGTSGGNEDQGGDTSVTMGTEIGEKLPTFSAALVGSSDNVSIKDHRGKVVVINFWGTWCDPCKSELPEFSEIAGEYADSVSIIALHSTKDQGTAEAYVSENFSDSKIIFAYDEPLNAKSDKYYHLADGTGYYPYTLILDKNGVITFKDDGAISYEALKAEIDKALAK